MPTILNQTTFVASSAQASPSQTAVTPTLSGLSRKELREIVAQQID
jgi:hypothetical protein